MMPISDVTAAIMSVTFLPQRSAAGEDANAPTKQPACKVETIFASRSAVAVLPLPKSPNFLAGVSR